MVIRGEAKKREKKNDVNIDALQLCRCRSTTILVSTQMQSDENASQHLHRCQHNANVERHLTFASAPMHKQIQSIDIFIGVDIDANTKQHHSTFALASIMI